MLRLRALNVNNRIGGTDKADRAETRRREFYCFFDISLFIIISSPTAKSFISNVVEKICIKLSICHIISISLIQYSFSEIQYTGQTDNSLVS